MLAQRTVASFSRPLLAVAGGGGGGYRRWIAKSPSLLSQNNNASTIENLVHTMDPIPYTASAQDISASSNNNNRKTTKGSHKKVSVVGCGQVGMATAYAMLNQVTAGTIALVDQDKHKLEGEAKDLEHGSAFHQNVRILASDEYSVSADSDLVIITAGVAQKAGESRLNLVERNVNIMKSIIPSVLQESPNAAICIVSNPCDLMAAVAAKIAGPSTSAGRIFGSGTCLDSSRLRSLLGKTFNVDAAAISGYVLGEHGDSSVPVWSSIQVGGVPLLKKSGSQEGPSEFHNDLHQTVVNAAYDVIQRKKYTNWAVGLTGAYIANAVLHDTRHVMPVSTCVRGLYSVEQDVFVSVPCVMGSNGVEQVIDLPLTDLEEEKFRASVQTIWDIQKNIWDKI